MSTRSDLSDCTCGCITQEQEHQVTCPLYEPVNGSREQYEGFGEPC